MIIAPVYIVVRFLQRFVGFFYHWYVGATRQFWSKTLYVLRAVRNFTAPDTGTLAIKAVRYFAGGLLYILLPIVSLAFYAVWVLLPPYAALMVVEGLFL